MSQADNPAMKFCRKSPCKDCPYRLDAPLQKWHVSEFEKVLRSETDQFGFVFYCHKKDGHVCVGFLMNQEKRNFPNLVLRLTLSSCQVDRSYLDNLSCKSLQYDNVYDMVRANFPELIQTTHMQIRLRGKITTRRIWLNEKELLPGKSQKVYNHSRDGFNWGYYGSGPTQLALAICIELFGTAGNYWDFKDRYIATLPLTDFDVTLEIPNDFCKKG
jgi:hypothetical protein